MYFFSLLRSERLGVDLFHRIRVCLFFWQTFERNLLTLLAVLLAADSNTRPLDRTFSRTNRTNELRSAGYHREQLLYIERLGFPPNVFRETERNSSSRMSDYASTSHRVAHAVSRAGRPAGTRVRASSPILRWPLLQLNFSPTDSRRR